MALNDRYELTNRSNINGVCSNPCIPISWACNRLAKASSDSICDDILLIDVIVNDSLFSSLVPRQSQSTFLAEINLQVYTTLLQIGDSAFDDLSLKD